MIKDFNVKGSDWIFEIDGDSVNEHLTPIMLIVDYLLWITKGEGTHKDRAGDLRIDLIVKTPLITATFKDYPIDINNNYANYYYMLTLNHQDMINEHILEKIDSKK